MTGTLTPREYSEAGANYLDRVWPNWHCATDPVILNISSPNDCVLGQLAGSYDRGKELLGIDEQFCMQHGFFATTSVFGLERTAEYRNLTVEWLDRIAERRRETTRPAAIRRQRLAESVAEIAIGLLVMLSAW